EISEFEFFQPGVLGASTVRYPVSLHHRDGARRSRNQNSEYLAQRRKACPAQRRRSRKKIKLPDLAFLASWRENNISTCDQELRTKICASRKNLKHRNAEFAGVIYFLFSVSSVPPR